MCDARSTRSSGLRAGHHSTGPDAMIGDHSVAPTPSGGSARDLHYFGPGPKRMLCLDGGGVRGVITVAFLELIEQVLSEREGRDIRLGDWFDLVGGTSTGAVIAGALALGFRTTDLKDFYL